MSFCQAQQLEVVHTFRPKVWVSSVPGMSLTKFNRISSKSKFSSEIMKLESDGERKCRHCCRTCFRGDRNWFICCSSIDDACVGVFASSQSTLSEHRQLIRRWSRGCGLSSLRSSSSSPPPPLPLFTPKLMDLMVCYSFYFALCIISLFPMSFFLLFFFSYLTKGSSRFFLASSVPLKLFMYEPNKCLFLTEP